MPKNYSCRNSNVKSKCHNSTRISHKVLLCLQFLHGIPRYHCGVEIKDIIECMKKNFTTDGDVINQVKSSLTMCVRNGFIHKTGNKYSLIRAAANIQLISHPKKYLLKEIVRVNKIYPPIWKNKPAKNKLCCCLSKKSNVTEVSSISTYASQNRPGKKCSCDSVNKNSCGEGISSVKSFLSSCLKSIRGENENSDIFDNFLEQNSEINSCFPKEKKKKFCISKRQFRKRKRNCSRCVKYKKKLRKSKSKKKHRITKRNYKSLCRDILQNYDTRSKSFLLKPEVFF